MDINGWLTVISVFTAIFALIPKEDLKFTFQRTTKLEKWSILFIVLVLIPYLIIFPKLILRFSYLNKFCIPNGFASEDIAFVLFYLAFLWLVIRLFWLKPKLKVNRDTIEDFLELLNEKPFEEFFKIFTKYTSGKEIDKEWTFYEAIIFDPKFLNGILTKEPTYLLQFWKHFSSEKEFQSVFRFFLENEKSIYYKEIKEHWNSYSLLDDKPFLTKVPPVTGFISGVCIPLLQGVY